MIMLKENVTWSGREVASTGLLTMFIRFQHLVATLLRDKPSSGRIPGINRCWEPGGGRSE
jgi:hypothetical protein